IGLPRLSPPELWREPRRWRRRRRTRASTFRSASVPVYGTDITTMAAPAGGTRGTIFLRHDVAIPTLPTPGDRAFIGTGTLSSAVTTNGGAGTIATTIAIGAITTTTGAVTIGTIATGIITITTGITMTTTGITTIIERGRFQQLRSPGKFRGFFFAARTDSATPPQQNISRVFAARQSPADPYAGSAAIGSPAE